LRHYLSARGCWFHLVDVSEASGRDPVEDFGVVMAELASFRDDLARKRCSWWLPKIDVAQDPDRVAPPKSACGR